MADRNAEGSNVKMEGKFQCPLSIKEIEQKPSPRIAWPAAVPDMIH